MRKTLKYLFTILITMPLFFCEDLERVNPIDPLYELTPPSNLELMVLSDSEINLNWTDNTAYESGFRIVRDGGSGFVKVADVNANVTEYTDSGLSFGQIYDYRVLAFTSVNNSDYSATATATACMSCVVDIDDNFYETIQIGDQEWMAENLRVTHYRDGTAITHVTDNSVWGPLATEAYCIYNNNASNEVDTYGALYNWYAVVDSRNIAPAGWHVPTDDEWKELEATLGMAQSEVDTEGYRGTNEGSKLAGNADLWFTGALENVSEFGSSGFMALPSGFRYIIYGHYTDMGSNTYFWSTTQRSEYSAWIRHLKSNGSDILRSYDNKDYGFAIRCLRD
jgi:uncharacterized protein (TIGR02145 family)